MNQACLNFRDRLYNQAKEKKLGHLIIISGMSGSGKSLMADFLVAKHGCSYIDKYVTRVFRPKEIEDIRAGKDIGIKPVVGNYNDGEKSPEEQKKLAGERTKAFIKKSLPFCYVNNGDELYGFYEKGINNNVENGKDCILICNDTRTIQDLKNIYRENCTSYYVHRAHPKNKDIFMEIAMERGDTPESAENRYQKAIKDFDRYTNNVTLYDHVLLNTENGIQRIEQMSKDMISKKEKKPKPKGPKIYVFIGNTGSGKDKALKTIEVHGMLHSIILPKYATRKRNENDGDEIICPEDENFDINSCDLQYTKHGTTYGIKTYELQERLNDGISSSLVLSDSKSLEKLEKLFPGQIVTIFVHGLSKKEYAIQEKKHLNEEYVKKRLQDYDKDTEFYYNYFLDFDHVLINNGDSADMKLQIDTIMEYYEKDRDDLQMNNLNSYLEKAKMYMARFQKNNIYEDFTKE